jgi:uncharacterized protein YutD
MICRVEGIDSLEKDKTPADEKTHQQNFLYAYAYAYCNHVPAYQVLHRGSEMRMRSPFLVVATEPYIGDAELTRKYASTGFPSSAHPGQRD